MPGATIRSSSRAEYARLRFWRNTDVARLEPRERAVLLKGLLGHEWDEDLDNGFRPPSLFRLSETTIDNVPYVQDCGSVFDSGTATHHLTLYRHASGALVFGAGTVQWAWGLDAHHDTETGVPPERVNESTTRVGVDPNGPDRNVRQATVNLFADMGVQPATLAPDLVRAEASGDREPPVSRIDEPRTGSSLPPGPVQISGESHDRGGGCVAAVEVSVDGGATWHPAEGREAWRYEWKPEGSGTRDDCVPGGRRQRQPRSACSGASPSPCQRRREGQGAVRLRARRHDQVMKIANVAVRSMKSHGSKVRDWLRNNCPDEPPGVRGIPRHSRGARSKPHTVRGMAIPA